MDRILDIASGVAIFCFGLAFYFEWERFAEGIIMQNEKQYRPFKKILKVLFKFMGVIAILGGIKVVFLG